MPAKRQNTKRPWRDPDDAPELGDDYFARASVLKGETLVRRGRGRPAGSGSKVSTTVRFDRDVVAAFKAKGKGWQTRMNAALRAAAFGGTRLRAATGRTASRAEPAGSARRPALLRKD